MVYHIQQEQEQQVFDIEETLERLLEQEDTDKDYKITINDRGTKKFYLAPYDKNSHLSDPSSSSFIEVSGTYPLSNLLSELVLIKEQNQHRKKQQQQQQQEKKLETSADDQNEGITAAANKILAPINFDKVFENPVQRISRMIRDYYWAGLTRSVDEKGLSKIMHDDKFEDKEGISPNDKDHIVYVPHHDKRALRYFCEVAQRMPALQVVQLPSVVTPAFVDSLNKKPGILALALRKKDGTCTFDYEDPSDVSDLEGVPFVVPGGRFNESKRKPAS